MAAIVPADTLMPDEGDVDHSGAWLACISVDWHTDSMFFKWSALALVDGKCTVEARRHMEAPVQTAEMEPGDLIILNIHEEHRAYSPHLEQATFLVYDFEKRPSRKKAEAALRGTFEFEVAMMKGVLASA